MTRKEAMGTKTRYYTKYGHDGIPRLYVEEAEVKILKTRQGKKTDIKAAIGAIDLIRQGIDEVLLERYIDD